MNTLAFVLRPLRKYDEAETLWRRSTQLRRKFYGQDHRLVAANLLNLAGVLEKKGEVDQAIAVYRESIDMFRRVDSGSPEYANALINSGILFNNLGRYTEAEALNREAVEVRTTLFGADHVNVSDPLHGLARALLGQDRCEEAEPLYRGVINLRKGSTHDVVALARSGLGDCLTRRGQFEEAEPMLIEGHERLKTSRGEHDKSTQKALERVIRLYELWGQADKFAEYAAMQSAPGPPGP